MVKLFFFFSTCVRIVRILISDVKEINMVEQGEDRMQRKKLSLSFNFVEMKFLKIVSMPAAVYTKIVSFNYGDYCANFILAMQKMSDSRASLLGLQISFEIKPGPHSVRLLACCL